MVGNRDAKLTTMSKAAHEKHRTIPPHTASACDRFCTTTSKPTAYRRAALEVTFIAAEVYNFVYSADTFGTNVYRANDKS